MKRVVVIGGGYGGITVARELDDEFEVVLIEAKDQFVHHAAALRAAVDPDWAQAIFLSYDNLLTNGRVVHGTAMKVDGTTVHVSDGSEITGDYLVLATGTAYPFPAKLMETTAAIAQARIARSHTDLQRARRVLLVGAGAVGVELAGELTERYPDLTVIMLDKADEILSTGDYEPALRRELRAQLTQRNVEFVLGSSLGFLPPVDVATLSPFEVETKDGRIIEADMWFRCYGSRVASAYLGEDYEELKRGDGSVRVDSHLRVEGRERVFAVGDITAVPESKRADAAREHAQVVARNIRDLAAGRAPSATYQPGKRWVVLPLGQSGGASQLQDPQTGQFRVVGPDETNEIKGQDLMLDMVRGQLRL
ncbi:FAD-dependent oxidoreductase [Buchananella hordeovulneris]|uniref:FAD-dependent oxidoreductase n=1 Tax=Buchananella hordeovulneris TaxID=52770 RepID=A0A1Q5PXT2_9ACTO|nr:FAD-dependent oxidoreductase [Buchananella hordeovulneris]MDO5080781.1 FAD-dependent oxidoreductase [Buchananella hordeovulneris]OKL52306.1 FAD-dependent oxidoreductase [Buchananella hordeovulneris]RRD45503.1 FAD-dependent oxidoreductase [Buchananella hordeovulneris]RRD50478.1 FAD-dependent oxidoreductase [Buchananella hordeovulneris]